MGQDVSTTSGRVLAHLATAWDQLARVLQALLMSAALHDGGIAPPQARIIPPSASRREVPPPAAPTDSPRSAACSMTSASKPSAKS